MAMQYSNKVMENFFNPKNMGKLDNPDASGRVGNPKCGDIMEMQIKVSKKKDGENADKEYIKDIKFQTFGCAAAISTSSMITQLAKGKTLEESKKITKDDVADALGNLPKIKMHCSNLADEALRKTIENYEKQKLQKDCKKSNKEMEKR